MRRSGVEPPESSVSVKGIGHESWRDVRGNVIWPRFWKQWAVFTTSIKTRVIQQQQQHPQLQQFQQELQLPLLHHKTPAGNAVLRAKVANQGSMSLGSTVSRLAETNTVLTFGQAQPCLQAKGARSGDTSKVATSNADADGVSKLEEKHIKIAVGQKRNLAVFNGSILSHGPTNGKFRQGTTNSESESNGVKRTSNESQYWPNDPLCKKHCLSASDHLELSAPKRQKMAKSNVGNFQRISLKSCEKMLHSSYDLPTKYEQPIRTSANTIAFSVRTPLSCRCAPNGAQGVIFKRSY